MGLQQLPAGRGTRGLTVLSKVGGVALCPSLEKECVGWWDARSWGTPRGLGPETEGQGWGLCRRARALTPAAGRLASWPAHSQGF